MLRQGEWRATNQEKAGGKIVGFHLSSLYSPVGWLSWGACARSYEIAKDDEQLLKAWTNTTLGLSWAEKGEAPDWGILFDRREHYRIGVVPRGGYVLTAGVDVQNDRLEIEIVAWGPNKESWSVDYRIIYGSPSELKTWNMLSEILQEEFEGEDGVWRKINMTAVDAGFSTQEVYAWVRTQQVQRVMAIKGVDNSLMPVNAPTKVDVSFRGKKINNGVRLWKIGVSMLKGEIYTFLKRRVGEDGIFPHGYMHFPEYNTEYFKQLTAEQLITKMVKGYPKREWQKTRDRNEALDCRVFARAAAIALGIDRWSENRWEKISGQKSERLEVASVPTKTERPVTAVKNNVRPKIVRSNWM
jgi:phage terminase large subunit GpA-like protein